MDLNKTKELMSLMQQAQTIGPQEMIQRLSSNNPNAATEIQKILSSGQNPKDIVLKKLRDYGIDPNTLFKN